MLNWAINRDPEKARAMKSLYKGVLETLVALVENGDGRELPAVVRHLHEGQTLTWRASGATGAACTLCGCDQWTYEPEGEGLAFEFCPACWSMRGEDSVRGGSFVVSRHLDKRVRDMPPGTQLAIHLDGEQFPLGPSDATDSPEELEHARERYRTAARRPLEIGRQVWMGRLCYDGTDGVDRDYEESRLWFSRAARWGHAEALSMLGRLAFNGLGEPRDPGKAVELCRQAAERGCAGAETSMGRFCWEGEHVAEDRVAAVEWWRRAARSKDAEAQLWLGHAMILGEGVARDAGEGLALVREAAQAGEPEAQWYLGTLLLEGRAGPCDPEEAREWLTKAAGQGHAGAAERLAGLAG